MFRIFVLLMIPAALHAASKSPEMSIPQIKKLASDAAAIASYNYGYDKDNYMLIINIEEQKMYLTKDGGLEKTYTISSAKNGIGSELIFTLTLNNSRKFVFCRFTVETLRCDMEKKKLLLVEVADD